MDDEYDVERTNELIGNDNLAWIAASAKEIAGVRLSSDAPLMEALLDAKLRVACLKGYLTALKRYPTPER